MSKIKFWAEQINFFSTNGQALAGVKEYMVSEKGFKKFESKNQKWAH